MSNSLAIAAVTATLRDLLKLVRQPLPGDPDPDTDLADAEVVCKPVDKARPEKDAVNTLNLFLYETVPDGALRNMEIPPLPSGETGSPPLPLRLRYLLTAFGRNNDDLLAHRMLGRAMSLLQDRAVLMPADIQAALPGADLHRQIERVRITAQPLSIEEMSKLWTIFQVNYRLSAAYEASVVLIDGARTSRTPLPVLKRGPLDHGPEVYPDPTPPYPELIDLTLPANQPSARLGTAAVAGDVVTLIGRHLDGDAVALRFWHPLLTAPLTLPARPGATASRVQFQLPVNDIDWPAGYWTVAVVVSRAGEPDHVSNVLSFSIAPRVIAGLPAVLALGGGTRVALPLTVSPQVWPAQRASLLLGAREVRADAHAAKTVALGFTIDPASPGEWLARVRIDGVDSFVVADYSARPPAFDATQKVTVTP